MDPKSERTGLAKIVRSHGWRSPSVHGRIHSVFWQDLSACFHTEVASALLTHLLSGMLFADPERQNQTPKQNG